MKQVKLYLPALISLCLILLLTLVFTNELKKKKNNEDNIVNEVISLKIETEELNNCNDLNIYNDYISLYCLKNINVIKGSDKKDLNDALNNNLKIEDLTNNMEKTIDNLTEDIIYIDNKNISNNGLKIIACKNGSYIIGSLNLEYNEKLCV